MRSFARAYGIVLGYILLLAFLASFHFYEEWPWRVRPAPTDLDYDDEVAKQSYVGASPTPHIIATIPSSKADSSAVSQSTAIPSSGTKSTLVTALSEPLDLKIPLSHNDSKAVVMATLQKQDTDWVAKDLPEYVGSVINPAHCMGSLLTYVIS